MLQLKFLNQMKKMKTVLKMKKKEKLNFKKEINFLASMNHANIVHFFGWTVWMNKRAIVMEFMHTSLHSGKICFL